MEAAIVEIRAAEGGDDAKALVREQLRLYERRARHLGLDMEMIEDLPALVSFRASGESAYNLFRDEAGGHRWQRIPPNEKRGRVHTSTVTVAVFEDDGNVSWCDDSFDICDVDYHYDRGTGPGGQNKNKVETRVTATHVPTGQKVVCDVERTQGQNKRLATALLKARVVEGYRRTTAAKQQRSRKRQIGSGMRGDKRRTIRWQDGRVVDHVTGQRWNMKKYLEGEW